MKKQQNITHDSTERWVEARLIRHGGTVETYPNYMVSDHGRVASLVDNHGNKRRVMKILKPCQCDKLGHLRVRLYNDKKKYARTIHRLMLSSFHPEQYFEGAEVDHKDRCPTNNHLDNLRWTDHNGNCANRAMNPLKKIRVTWLDDGHIEEFDNMKDCSKAFGKSTGWCNSVIILLNGFNAKYNILIEKI